MLGVNDLHDNLEEPVRFGLRETVLAIFEGGTPALVLSGRSPPDIGLTFALYFYFALNRCELDSFFVAPKVLASKRICLKLLCLTFGLYFL